MTSSGTSRQYGVLLSFVFIVSYSSKSYVHGIESCPMEPVRAVIGRSVELAGADAMLQMQIIRRILEDIYGGSWGVLIVKDVSLISTTVHWTIPDIRSLRKKSPNDVDGQLPAFCLHVSPTTNWQYNIFKAGVMDVETRMTVDDVLNKIRKKPYHAQTEFDERLTKIVNNRRSKFT